MFTFFVEVQEMITYEDSFHTDVERIEASRVVVFYHKNCPDGCTAACNLGEAGRAQKRIGQTD